MLLAVSLPPHPFLKHVGALSRSTEYCRYVMREPHVDSEEVNSVKNDTSKHRGIERRPMPIISATTGVRYEFAKDQIKQSGG
jgi:hypothetical protein